MTFTETTLTFPARDGYPLSGLVYSPPSPKGGVLISAGTGFRKEYYRHFAKAGAERGFAVLLYDCRGIGSSAPDNLAAMNMTYTDWGHYDMPAAVDALEEAASGTPLAHIAHSVGGHFLGLMDNQDKLKAHAFVCVGSGYWGDHKLFYRAFVSYFWHLHGPRMLRRHGFIPSGGGWSGTALPRGVFEPWRKWCLQRKYFLESMDDLAPHHFEKITAVINSFIYTDDPVANEKSAQVMLDLYPNAVKQLTLRQPSDYGLKKIGHNGLFPTRMAAAWGEIWDWVEGQI